MQQGFLRVLIVSMMCAPLSGVGGALAEAPKADAPYPRMAPVERYLIADRDAEIALARTAAPRSISDQAEIQVLGPHGYEPAAKGTNGFVCLVLRSWAAGFDDPQFWNPKVRAPNCYNPAAVRSYLPVLAARARWVLAGKSKDQVIGALKAAFDKRELPVAEVGAMTYMMSKQGYLNDDDHHWHTHLMFFVPQTDVKSWGAGLAGVPIFGSEDAEDRSTVFMVTVRKWSDGTPDTGQ